MSLVRITYTTHFCTALTLCHTLLTLCNDITRLFNVLPSANSPPTLNLLTAVLPGRAEHLSGSGLKKRLKAQRSRTAQRATFTAIITHGSA